MTTPQQALEFAQKQQALANVEANKWNIAVDVLKAVASPPLPQGDEPLLFVIPTGPITISHETRSPFTSGPTSFTLNPDPAAVVRGLNLPLPEPQTQITFKYVYDDGDWRLFSKTESSEIRLPEAVEDILLDTLKKEGTHSGTIVKMNAYIMISQAPFPASPKAPRNELPIFLTYDEAMWKLGQGDFVNYSADENPEHFTFVDKAGKKWEAYAVYNVEVDTFSRPPVTEGEEYYVEFSIPDPTSPNGFSHGIDFINMEQDLSRMIFPDAIVIPQQKVNIGLPKSPVDLISSDSRGFTRIDLARKTIDSYRSYYGPVSMKLASIEVYPDGTLVVNIN